MSENDEKQKKERRERFVNDILDRILDRLDIGDSGDLVNALADRLVEQLEKGDL